MILPYFDRPIILPYLAGLLCCLIGRHIVALVYQAYHIALFYVHIVLPHFGRPVVLPCFGKRIWLPQFGMPIVLPCFGRLIVALLCVLITLPYLAGLLICLILAGLL